jgi:hypothetical protein
MDSGAIKIAAVAVGAYLLYEWLQSSGLWAQWFGGNSFTTTSALDTYCSANPTATASMTVNGQNASAPCSQWLSALQSSAVPTTAPSSSPAGSTPATTAPVSAVDPNLAAQLTAGMQKQVGRTIGTISEWNWVLQNIVKSSLPIITASTPYGTSQISATQYLQEQQSLGMSGLGFTSPYSWGSRLVN